MSSLSLLDLVRGYWKSGDFEEIDCSEEHNYVVVQRRDVGGTRDIRTTWIVPKEIEAKDYESKLRPLIDRVSDEHRVARGCVLLSGGGLTRETYQHLRGGGIDIRVPIQFFDAEFKKDDAPEAAAAIQKIRRLDPRLRVSQPYERRDAEGTVVDQGPDLLDTLITASELSSDSSVRIVVGRAGIGKSFLANALFDRLYKGFMDAKKKQGVGSRPIPLLPHHLGTHTPRTELLIENFIRSEVATPVARETFEWLLVHGYTTWLLDGLDELIAADHEFFDYLEEQITAPYSKAQILVWSRDSLVTTSDTFTEFREFVGAGLETYHLLEWDRQRKRDFAWIQLEGMPSSRNERDDPPEIAQFVRHVEQPPLRRFSGLPFYCSVLWDDRDHLSEGDTHTELDVLDRLVKGMVSRETEEKQLIDPTWFETDGLESWLEWIATDYVDEGTEIVSKSKVREYGKAVLRPDLDDEEREDALLGLLRFPFFTQGAQSGELAFDHELVAQAIASPAYARQMRTNPLKAATRIMARFDYDEPVLLRLIAQHLTSPEDVSPIVTAMKEGGERSEAYRVLLALLMIMRNDRDLFGTYDLNLEHSLLSRLCFKDRDLRGMSFRRSDLSHTRFEGCDLNSAKFEGAYCHETTFAGDEGMLAGADFGNDISRVESIRVNARFMRGDDSIREWLARATQSQWRQTEPCSTARQLRHLFCKFIWPMGTHRRAKRKRTGLVAGKRYPGAARPEACVRSAQRHGYLVAEGRNLFARPEGSRLGELVRFVKDSRISDGLEQVIAEICPKAKCAHQLVATGETVPNPR